MSPLYIIKLGGSILTEKRSRRPALRVRRVREIAAEFQRARKQHPNLRLILLHGAGSFGHPLAYRYRLMDRKLSAQTFIGAGHTIAAMRELGTALAEIFLDAGVPIIPLQTSSFVRMRGKSVLFDNAILEMILDNGGVPLFGGDVVLSDTRRSTIVSADALAVALSKKFRNAKLFFATDIEGVYPRLPVHKGERPLKSLGRSDMKRLLEQRSEKATRTDVTGGMQGKLRALLGARHTSARIFNGNKKDALMAALSGKQLGTLIRL